MTYPLGQQLNEGEWAMTLLTRRAAALSLLSLAAARAAHADNEERPVRLARLKGGVGLHYVEAGSGQPLVLVHGSLGDLTYWSGQVGPFSERFRTIAVSRRYNRPNTNAAIRGYSAVIDAQDLAQLIQTLELGPCHIVGHSYGALSALFLGATRPDLVRTLTLAEPPAVSLLQHLPDPYAQAGRSAYADIQVHMVAPMKAAFTAGRMVEGVRIFIDYVLGKPGSWDAMSPATQRETLYNADEWEVLLPDGELFPQIGPEEVRRIACPALILSGARSYSFLGLIDQALLAFLPRQRRIVFPDAGHQMWLQEPVACREAVFELCQLPQVR
jgi:pimeloyl-ACP methyl ester carboxylesterase